MSVPYPFRVLVVDDEPMILRVMARMVSRLGAEPVGVASLAEARRQLAASRFNLVLSDVALGDGSGLDLAAACIAAGAPPVALMSGALDRLEHAALRLGVPTLPKPVDLTALRTVLDAVRTMPEGEH